MTFPDESGVATQEKGRMQLMSPLQGKGGARIFMGRILGLGPWTAHLDWLICYCLGGDGRKLIFYSLTKRKQQRGWYQAKYC